MDSVSDAPGPSTPNRKRRQRNKHTVVAQDGGPAPEAPAVDGMDVDPPAEASSSKLPLDTLKTGPRRKRPKAPKLVALPPVDPAPRTKDQRKADKQLKKAAKLENKERKKAAQAKGKRKDENAWDYVPLAQDEASRIPPLWSRDRKFYFITSGASIHVHSSVPGFKRLSTLSSTDREGHKGKITGLQLHPTNPLQLLSCGSDGTVKAWDWAEDRLVRTITITERGSVGHMCTGQVGEKWYIFATAAIWKDDGGGKVDDSQLRHRVVRIPLSPPRIPDQTDPVRHLGKISQPPSALFISPSHQYLVALAGNKAHTYRLPHSIEDEAWSTTCVKFVSDQPFTCGLFAPASPTSNEEEWFATGDVKGMIRLWHGLSSAFRQVEASAQAEEGHTEKRLPTTSLHWHAHAVGALAFTPSSAQLLSVGEESVLVQWHLASGKREYIPRLGGRALVSLAVKEGAMGVDEEWWMGMADGGMIRVSAASGQISTVGQTIRLDPLRPKYENSSYPLATHPPTNSIVLPSSHPSTLQFVDPTTSSVLFNLEVSASNRVSRRDEKELEPIAVEHVAFNESRGKGEGDRWMVSVEGRRGDESEGGGATRTLKMWKWTGERYTVNTQYPRPHDLEDLVHVSFSPSRPSDPSADPLLLTCAKDGSAKVWHVQQFKRTSEGKSGKKTPLVEKFWSCRNTFSYRDMPIYAAAFSPDATIIALAHGSVITLWDAQSGGLLKTLSGFLDSRQMAFVSRDGRYLATTGVRSGLAIWDLLSCHVSWSSDSQSTLRLVDLPTIDTFVLVHSPDNTLYRSTLSVFSPNYSTPIRQKHIRHKVNRLIALPGSTRDSLEFVGVAFSGEVLRFGDDVSYSRARRNKVEKKDEKDLSIWQEMFGKDAFVNLDLATASADEVNVGSGAEVKRKTGRPSEVFDGPSHTLPPPSLLFDSFIDQLLGNPIDNMAARPTEQEEGILYESGVAQETRIDGPVTLVPEVKGRQVTDQEVKEVQTLFEQILSLPTSKTAPTLPNGNGVQGTEDGVPNSHVDVTMDEPHEMENGDLAVTPAVDANTKKQRKASRKVSTNKSPKTPNGDLSQDEDAAEQAVGRKRKSAPKS